MSYELAEKAAAVALKRMGTGTPVPETFKEIASLVLPSLPEATRNLVATLDAEEDVEALCEQFAHVLTSEPPSLDVNGFFFGLAEMVFGDAEGNPPGGETHPEHTLYICGSMRFDPSDMDWPCGPEWWPEERYFQIPSFKALSDHCATLDYDAAWLVACGLIEPLSIALVGEACRRIGPKDLLLDAPFRGIGSGYDGGDLRDVGVVTRDGFASPALLPVKTKSKPRAAANAPKKPKKKSAKKAAKAARKKPRKVSGTKATARRGTSTGSGAARAKRGSKPAGSKAKKASTKKAATKKASSKKPGAKRPVKKTRRKAAARSKAPSRRR